MCTSYNTAAVALGMALWPQLLQRSCSVAAVTLGSFRVRVYLSLFEQHVPRKDIGTAKERTLNVLGWVDVF